MNYRFWLGVILLGLIITGPLSADQPPPAAESAAPEDAAAQHAEYYELLRLFVDTLDQVERNYVEDISRRKLLEAAIEGMISELDQHSDYIAPEDLDRFKTDVESEFGGIGIQVQKQQGGPVTIISPIVGSPAYRAGLLAGDEITHIKGEPTDELGLVDAVRKMKGPVGTPVKVTVRHALDGTTQEVELVREIVRLETVLGDRRQDDDSWNYLLDEAQGIGYIRITGFARRTTLELRKALRQLAEQKAKGLILDLRHNPGGLLSTAIQVSDMFLSNGRIVSTEGRNTKPQAWDARSGGPYEEAPIAVLVNRASASASEIVAACLQDHGRAVVIGERTFGKGSVQNVIELESGRSALKLTTAGYIRPSGLNIHRFPDNSEEDEWGVRPNEGYEVEVGLREVRRLLEVRRQRDIVGGQPGDTAAAETGGDSENKVVDRVLIKAIEHLEARLASDAKAVAVNSDE